MKMQTQQPAISLEKLQVVVDSFYQCNGITPPTLEIIDIPGVNARAVAYKKNAIALTPDLVSRVTDGNLTAVDFLSFMAHESGHINNKLLFQSEQILFTAATAGAAYAIFKSPAAKIKNRREIFKNLAVTAGGVFALGWCRALGKPFLQRQEELHADKYAAIIIGPDTYIAALKKLAILNKSENQSSDLLLSHPLDAKRFQAAEEAPPGVRPCIVAQESESLVHKETTRRHSGSHMSRAPAR